MNNKVIGIISYLPEESFKREPRKELLTNLIKKLDEIFNLPIIIVAQGWKEFTVDSPNVTVYIFEEKLGITGARKTLREIFLESPYEYLIMLDDDCVVKGDSLSAYSYLQQIDEHPGKFYEFKTSLLKFFCIHKSIFKEQGFDDINPEDGDGFEDRVFVGKLRERFPDKRYIFSRGTLSENSISTKDPFSTWYHKQDLTDMIDKTNKIVGNNN